MSKIGLYAIEDSQPDARAWEVKGASVHVDSCSQWNDKFSDWFRHATSALYASECHWDGSGTARTGDSHGLCRDEALQVDKGVCTSHKIEQITVHNEEMGNHSDDSCYYEVANVGEGFG